MANEMEHLTDRILRGAVERQVEDEFDTHPVFITLMTDFGYAYVRELDKCLEHEKPFERLHTRIGGRLAKLNDTLKQLHRKRRSKNFRGNIDECEIWRKVK